MAKKDKKSKKNKDKEKFEQVIPEQAEADISGPLKRLNRVAGQIEGIQRMLKKGESFEAVLIQCKAANAAFRAAEQSVLEHYLELAVEDIAAADGKKSREEHIARLRELYRPL